MNLRRLPLKIVLTFKLTLLNLNLSFNPQKIISYKFYLRFIFYLDYSVIRINLKEYAKIDLNIHKHDNILKGKIISVILL